MENEHLKYWVAFNRIPGMGLAKYQLLERHFGPLVGARTAPQTELTAAGLDAKTVQRVSSHRSAIDPDAEIQAIEAAWIRALTWRDDEYPARLKEIYDLPPVLYALGELLPEDERSVAVVGTRRPSAYGREAGHRMAYDLANAGVTVVSGLARGIDAIAHRAALEAEGRTVA